MLRADPLPAVLALALAILSLAAPAAAAALPKAIADRDSSAAHIVNLIARDQQHGGMSGTVKIAIIAVACVVGLLILGVILESVSFRRREGGGRLASPCRNVLRARRVAPQPLLSLSPSY